MYGSIGSHGMSTAVDIIAPILGIAAIAAAIVLFIKFASKKADKTKPLTKFFSFDHLFIESITKFLYVFSTTSIAALSLYVRCIEIRRQSSGGLLRRPCHCRLSIRDFRGRQPPAFRVEHDVHPRRSRSARHPQQNARIDRFDV